MDGNLSNLNCWGHSPVGLIAQLVEHSTGVAEVEDRVNLEPTFGVEIL